LDITELKILFSSNSNITAITESLAGTDPQKLHLKGLAGSSAGILTSVCFSKTGRSMLVIQNDRETAAYYFNDLANLLGKDNVLFFPSSHRRSIQYDQPDNAGIVLRTEALNRLRTGNNKMIIVTYPEALIEKVITKNKLKTSTLDLSVDDKISVDSIIDTLNNYDFERTDFVYEPGQFSIRGSIIDIFSFSNESPYRLDFFGDRIESVRTFDIQTQLSIEQLDKISVVSNIQKNLPDETSESFFNYIDKSTLVWAGDIRVITDRINTIYEKTYNKFNIPEFREKYVSAKKIIETGNSILDKLQCYTVIETGPQYHFEPDMVAEFNTSLQPRFNKNFSLLCENLYNNQLDGYHNIILSENTAQIERLETIFRDINRQVKFTPVLNVLHEGFIDHDLKICIYTDHQIFDRYHKFQLGKGFSRKEAISLKEVRELQPGDYVVHIDHGIGKFGGLDKIDVNGKPQEAIRLIYKDNDILYVNIHSMHRISKYKGKEGIPPKIYKLGSGAWNRLKQNTKKKVKDIARELIALYAKRKDEKGFEFSPDTYLQHELEASFMYEDTPDQLEATQHVKKNMESDSPMDRLVCGDVGFGKTEIAVRAAFKAVADSKQVAILAPTTILVLQHYHTFRERLRDLPCNIDYLSRLKSAKRQKETLKKLSEGKIDIIIGTHRIIGKDVVFKDLGLLVIDEEQKFGVATKEKLKKIRLNVDTLTLTATPIPRTLQFSLMGARDLSIINTAPPNRYPIVTELHPFNEDIIQEAISYELDRNGQVFFIHNRIQNIDEIEVLVQRVCPGVRTVVAHGQMDGSKLENVMIDFISGDYDVLISTTIVESGLDIPNVNTILINNAQHFGLSDLHQLRGRVGRSNRKAFCYLLTPPLEMLTSDAQRRLKAIVDFSHLGSGFNIALQDLDIRGAGNLLGAEQSGFIADIGFDTYHRILDEAILELKEQEFKDLFSDEQQDRAIVSDMKFVNDCILETDLELLFPDDYISNISERINLYRELDSIKDEEILLKFEKHLIDRFGPMPQQTKELLDVVRLRRMAVNMGFEKIVLKNNMLMAYFISNRESPYYQSQTFNSILQYLQKIPQGCTMKESGDKLMLVYDNIPDLKTALGVFGEMVKE